MAVEAICAGCGKTWKVPDAARTYKCKQCGGKVAVAAEAPAPPTVPEPPSAPAVSIVEARRAKTVQRSTIAPLPPEMATPAKRDGGESRLKKPLIVGGAALVFAGVLTGIIIASQGPSLEDRMDDFALAWESASPDDLKGWFRPDYSEERWSDLAKTIDRRGWESSRPALSGRVIADETSSSASVDFKIGSGLFQTRWVKEQDQWKIARIMIPKYKEADDPPSANAKQALKATLATFRATWNEGRYTDVKDMAQQVPPPTWISRLDSLGERYASRLPLADDPSIRFRTRALALVVFSGADGVVTTQWKDVLGTWALTGLRFK